LEVQYSDEGDHVRLCTSRCLDSLSALHEAWLWSICYSQKWIHNIIICIDQLGK